MAIPSATLAITSAILNIPTCMAISSATVLTTSATTLSGYSTSHNWQSTSAIHHSGFTSATLAITSANSKGLIPSSDFPSTTHYKSSDTISATSKNG